MYTIQNALHVLTYSQNKHEVGIIFLFLWLMELNCPEMHNSSTYLICLLINTLMTHLVADPLMVFASRGGFIMECF